ncbi:MAG: TCP-1/cpn60 chaperonin family protein [Thermoplasmata archaeon]|nr:TCP-1/cpn60 chaperonin family protein [Thermoplasmata archaeon]MCI4341129.1 TCP-1/cpn60 chaperonin family protein [Thermoplasmata archaeon]
MLQGTPILVLKEGTERDRGRSAANSNIAAARAIADAVRSTLGPRGMDKMLVDSMGDITITNDGVTILKEVDVEHPAAKMLVEVAKTQDQQCGDGTTTAVVLAGELLKRAEGLLEQNIHPTIIVRGFQLGLQEAQRLLETEIGTKVKADDDQVLYEVASTAMGSKGVFGSREKLAHIAVKAVKRITEQRGGKAVADTSQIKLEKRHGGTIDDTSLIEGIILDKERGHPRMPRTVKDAKLALLNSSLEIKKTEIESKINIKSPTQIQGFLDEEDRTFRKIVESVKAAGANVVVCQKGIDDVVLHYLAKEGIYAVKQVKESDLQKLARATGAKIVTGIRELTAADLGRAAAVEEKKVGEEDMTYVTGCQNPRSVSILIRGGTEHVTQEVERALDDALKVVASVIEDGVICPGGGATEIDLAVKLRQFAPSVGGREQLAVEAFAQSLEVVPWALSENGGYDSINTLLELRGAHGGPHANRNVGVNLLDGKAADMVKLQVVEPLRVKRQALSSAVEVATMVLRIDDVIASKKGSSGPPGGAGGGHGH